MKKLFVLLICLFNVLYAQDANSILKDIQKRFGKIQDLSADVIQNSTKSKFFYQKENKYRIETTNNIIISDGNSIWNYNKKNNKVVISRPEDTEMTYTINNLVYSFPEQSKLIFEGKEKIGAEEYNILSMTPAGSSSNYKKIKIWADKTNMIRKVNVSDAAGNNLIFEFTNIKINSNIPDSRFSFEPAKGSEIIDLR